MVVLILVAGSLFACLVFSYLYLWTVSAGFWPSPAAVPPLQWPLAVAALLAISSGVVAYASRALARNREGRASIALAAALLLLAAASVLDGCALWESGLSPVESGYGALVYTFVVLQGFYVVVIAFMAVYTIARERAGLLDRARRVTFDNTMLLWHYTVVQGLAALLLVHGFPRLVP